MNNQQKQAIAIALGLYIIQRTESNPSTHRDEELNYNATIDELANFLSENSNQSKSMEHFDIFASKTNDCKQEFLVEFIYSVMQDIRSTDTLYQEYAENRIVRIIKAYSDNYVHNFISNLNQICECQLPVNENSTDILEFIQCHVEILFYAMIETCKVSKEVNNRLEERLLALCSLFQRGIASVTRLYLEEIEKARSGVTTAKALSSVPVNDIRSAIEIKKRGDQLEELLTTDLQSFQEWIIQSIANIVNDSQINVFPLVIQTLITIGRSIDN